MLLCMWKGWSTQNNAWHEINDAKDLKTKIKTRKEKRILVVNNVIVSKNLNKWKREEAAKYLNENMESIASTKKKN